MGLAGWFSWMGEHLDKLKALRDMTKNEEELKIFILQSVRRFFLSRWWLIYLRQSL